MRHTLAKAKGLGPSGNGSHHWWYQRISALALLPLTLWFVFSVIYHIEETYDSVLAWIEQPVAAILTLLYLSFMFFHARLGLQVVIEDYVHHEGMKILCLLISKGIIVLAAAISIFAVLRIAL